MEPSTATKPIVLTAEAIAAIASSRWARSTVVTHRALWHSDTSMAGVLTVEGGHRLGTHAHRLNHHHMWVIDGHAVVLGTAVGPGSYVHVPSGVDHDIDARATEGCTVFYLYLAPQPDPNLLVIASGFLRAPIGSA